MLDRRGFHQTLLDPPLFLVYANGSGKFVLVVDLITQVKNVMHINRDLAANQGTSQDSFDGVM